MQTATLSCSTNWFLPWQGTHLFQEPRHARSGRLSTQDFCAANESCLGDPTDLDLHIGDLKSVITGKPFCLIKLRLTDISMPQIGEANVTAMVVVYLTLLGQGDRNNSRAPREGSRARRAG